ncbi:MAG: autotransporter domain-containing protein [Rhodocyclaceae bacterium]|nr:autotransporter domain-containing protein [Rhodocyclaceae bacterium]
MNTDDAGTLDVGGMKIEGVLGRDDKARSAELGFGYGLIENVEIGLTFARETDRDPSPATKVRATGVGIKWVPIQNDTGWSLGVSFGYGHARVNERSAPDRFTEKEYSFAGLATYRLENGQVLHMNLGSTRVKVQADSDTAGDSETLHNWGVGYEFPLMEKLQLTAEVFGEEHAGPDKAIGLRYEILDGLRLYGSVGRGNDRGFGNLGIAWEF